MVQQFDIKGTGSWSLGDENKETWNYYKLWLNGCHFEDAEGHWAADFILSSYKNGLIEGMSANAFHPDDPLTRAQAAAILVRLLDYEIFPDDNSFEDTKGHWAQAAVDTARRNGIISGVGENLFDPEAPVSREQMAVMLDNLLKKRPRSTINGNNGIAFSDVTADNNPWSYQSIGAMKQYGIISGFDNGLFKPSQALTRAEMTVILDKANKFLEENR